MTDFSKSQLLRATNKLNYLKKPNLVNIFNDITTWITANKDSFIVESIMACVLFAISRLWTLRKNLPKTIKRLTKIKGMKYLGFIFLYALPLGTIGAMIIDQTTEPTFKNIALFIVIVATLIFNILIGHIRTLYKLNTDLIKANSKKMTNIDQTFTKVYEHIERTRTKE